MARYLDKLIVIDVEATCWKSKPPKGQENEIIEIGICVLDLETGKREEKESLFVRPERSTISPFCTELTTLTQKDVQDGLTFAEACHILQEKYLTRKRTWASFGDYDRRQFERQCHERNIHYPFGPTHINVKNLFAILHKQPREVGMGRACKILGLTLEGTHHRGIDDAWNIAAILQTLLFPKKDRETSKGQ